MAEENFYAAADRAIRQMDRDSLRAFNALKLARFDQASIVQAVLELYRKQAQKARREFLDIAMEAYLFALWLIDTEYPQEQAQAMVQQAITPAWVDSVLSEPDFVTLYRFDTETERKAQRLLESLSAVADGDYRKSWTAPTGTRNQLIDAALKAWTKQLGQYAINMTDYAMMQAYQDAGVEEVMWEDAGDHRVCGVCHGRNGKVYPIDEVPAKHRNCRCVLRGIPKKRFQQAEA